MAPPPNGNDGLYPAERKFLDHLKSGRPCWLGNDPSRIPPRPKEPVYSRDPDVANVIRGEIIGRFLVGKDAIQLPRGIVELSGYWIEGPVVFYFASIHVGLVFCNCHFASSVNLAFAETRAIGLPGSRLCEGIVFNSTVIRGNLNMNCGDEETGGEAFVADKDVLLMGARIHGDLNCSGGQFKAHNKAALLADRAKIDGDFMANENFLADGDVRFLGAQIGGAFSCVGGKIIARDEAALILIDVRISRGVMIENSCFRNQLSKGMGCAIVAEGLHVGGSLFLRESYLIGEARFSLIKVDGDLDFAGSMFHSTQNFALSARGANVGGNVHITDKMSANGTVDICGVEIKLGLNFVDANIQVDTSGASPSDVPAILAEHVRVGNAMLWRQMSGNGIVNLASSSVDTFSDEIDAWNDFTVVLDDFSYRKFVDADVTADSRRYWLSKQRRFSPKPYEQVAKVMRAMGKDIDAWDIEQEKRRLERTERDSNNSLRTPGWRRLWGRAIDTLTDFVYRPWKTVMWAITIVCMGALLFNVANESGCIVPNRPIVLANPDYNNAMKGADRQSKCPDAADRPTSVTKRLFPDYPEFHAFVYSLDVFIPVFALHQEPNWHPGPCLNRDISLRFLSWWHWLEIIAGWILTSLFLLSITGLLRPRQSSGERD